MDDGPTDVQLKHISDLIESQFNQQLVVDRLEEQLKTARDVLRTISEVALPQACNDAGLMKFTTTDGLALAIRDKFRCGQLDDGPDREHGRPRSERLEALSWLEDHGHGDLSKRKITVTLGKDSLNTAVELIQLLKSHRLGNSLLIDHERGVHAQTLSAFARKQIQQGYDVPLDKLGVYHLKVAEVKREK